MQSRHSIGEEEESQVGGLPGLYDENLPHYFHFHLPTQYCPYKCMLSWYYLFFVAHGGNTGKIMACVEDGLTLRTQSLQGHTSAHNCATLPLSHPCSCACPEHTQVCLVSFSSQCLSLVESNLQHQNHLKSKCIFPPKFSNGLIE